MSKPLPRIIYQLKKVPNGTLPGSLGYSESGYRNALLVSEGHYRLTIYRGKKVSRHGWSGGGPLYVHKTTLSQGTPKVLQYRYGYNTLNTCYMSGVNPAPGHLIYPTIPPWSQEQVILQNHYATGYKKARPGNPVAGLGQFILELKSLPQMPLRRLRKVSKNANFSDIPKLLRRELQDFRNLGSEYLNVVFGWKPFVKDLQEMYYLWHDIDRRMAQLVRENGKYIRRRSTVLDETSSTFPQERQNYNYAYALVKGASANIFGGSSQWTKTGTTKEKVWFSGSFRYYIPDTSSSLWDARARLALFGALPTPELLWNVLPWSWLVDWFANVGDIVSNASMNAVDNLTTRYSFVMRQISKSTTWQVTTQHPAQNSGNGVTSVRREWPAVSHTFNTVYTEVAKQRTGGGNPFGLNVQLSSLTGHQLGILAALGLSRSSVR